MKRIALLLSIILLLTGCSLVPDEYYSVKPHESTAQAQIPEAVEVSDYDGLTDAILRFIKAGLEEGAIRTVEYDGNVEEDLVQAVYDVVRLDPIGAFAVDYLNHNCVKILNYYEISLAITYRRSGYEIAAIQQAYSPQQLQGQVERSLRAYDDLLAMQVTEDQEYDIAALAEAYFLQNPEEMVELPEVQVSVFPDTGKERIVEVEFHYQNSYNNLMTKKSAVNESVNAAAEYIRYRHSDRDKTRLLYTYLTERFTYEPGTSDSPVWSALCGGVADPLGLAQGFRLICRKAGVECYTVSGLKDGQPYYWNIVSDDGDYRHIDLARDIAEDEGLWFMTDWDMGRYYWNTAEYPACVAEPAAQTTAVEEPAESIPAEEETT